MTIRAPTAEGFRCLLRFSRSSVARPPWFAAPVDAQEDEDSITVVFHAPAQSHGQVRIEASDESVTLRGRSDAMRLCALPCAIEAKGIEASRSGDLVRLRIPKKRHPTESTDASVTRTAT